MPSAPKSALTGARLTRMGGSHAHTETLPADYSAGRGDAKMVGVVVARPRPLLLLGRLGVVALTTVAVVAAVCLWFAPSASAALSFAPVTSYDTLAEVSDIASADFNGDGDPDLALVGPGWGPGA